MHKHRNSLDTEAFSILNEFPLPQLPIINLTDTIIHYFLLWVIPSLVLKSSPNKSCHVTPLWNPYTGTSGDPSLKWTILWIAIMKWQTSLHTQEINHIVSFQQFKAKNRLIGADSQINTYLLTIKKNPTSQ